MDFRQQWYTNMGYFATILSICFCCAILIDISRADEMIPLIVVNASDSSITLMWRGQHYFNDPDFMKDLRDNTVHYRPLDVHRPSELRPRPEAGKYSYEAIDQDILSGKKETYMVGNLVSDFVPVYETNGSMLVTVKDLEFYDTEYELQLRRTTHGWRDGEWRVTSASGPMSIYYSTKIGVPRHPPKIGPGSFRIVDVSLDQRTVRVYWRRTFMKREKYDCHIYEEGRTMPIDSVSGEFAEESHLTYTISLKRHYFHFKSVSIAGASEESSVINIPPQNEILPDPLAVSLYNETTGTTLMMWRSRLSRDAVSNYTVFWIDDHGKESFSGVRDLVFVDGGRTSIEVNGTGLIPLALSVNSQTSSSGIHLVRACH